MPRFTNPAAIRIYAAAQRFVDNALRADGSLFTPGAAIWTLPVIEDLYERFAGHPDVSSDTFEAKFRRQLRGDALTPPVDAAPATYQLAAEALYLHFLPVNGISGVKKRQVIGNVLGWSSAPVTIPSDLAQTLDQGIARAGQFYLAGRNYQIQFLLEFARAWKRLDVTARDQGLGDPWAFKQFLYGLPVVSAYAQRDLLLYLVHPDTFEPIMAREHKQQIAGAFAALTDSGLNDVDRRLAQIRAALAPEYGAELSFYHQPLAPLWQNKEAPPGDDEDEGNGAPDGVTGAAAGLSGTEQIRIALAEIVRQGGMATIRQIGEAVERRMGGKKLSLQGRASLRFFIGKVAVQKGYLYPYDKANPGWQITLAGRALLEQEAVSGGTEVLPHSLGAALQPYLTLATHLTDESYTATAIRDLLTSIVPPIAPDVALPNPDHLVSDLQCLRLLEQVDDQRYRRWPHLGDATPDLLARYAALTLLVPAGDEYMLPALTAPFDGLPYPPARWPLGEPLLRWYEAAGLVVRNADGTWQSRPGALDLLDDPRPTAQALNSFLANLRRARSSPHDLPPLGDEPLHMLSPAALEARVAEIQRELLIDRETILRIYRSLIAGHHVILSGPPGTGKTHLARLLPGVFWRDEAETMRVTLANDPALSPTTPLLEEPLRREGYLVEVVTATEDWGVRHIIGGITPRLQRNEHGASLIYAVTHGHLTRAVLANYVINGDISAEGVDLPRREHVDTNNNRYRGLWLVIDEFTRAQIDSAFGGLLTTLSGQRQPALTFPTDDGERTVRLPRDFRLIGTLNSFDRHFLNQMSEALKRRFTFIDVLPPGRDHRDEEQAMALFRAMSGLHENGVAGFDADAEQGRAAWHEGLSVRRTEDASRGDTLVRYVVTWPDDTVARTALAGFWRIFESARVYRQFGTAQAEATYRTLLAGRAAGFDWSKALDSALADTLADQLQVIARDELRVLLALLVHPTDSEALRKAIVDILNSLSAPRQSAHLLRLRLFDPSIDSARPEALTGIQVQLIFGQPAPLAIPPDGLFARRLIAFVNEQGL